MSVQGITHRFKSIFSKEKPALDNKKPEISLDPKTPRGNNNETKTPRGNTESKTPETKKVEEKPVVEAKKVVVDPKKWNNNEQVLKIILSYILTGTGADAKDLVALGGVCKFMMDLLEQPVYWTSQYEDYKKNYDGPTPDEDVSKLTPKEALLTYHRKKRGIVWKPKKKVVVKKPKEVTIDDPQVYYPVPIDTITYREDRDDAIIWFEQGNKKSVECATLNKLVEELTSPVNYDQYFCHTLMVTFRSFTERDTLFDKLVERYNIPPPKGCSNEEFMKWKSEKLDKVRLRVAKTVMYWIQNFYTYDFDEEMNQKVNEFVQMMESVKGGGALASGIKRELEYAKNVDGKGIVESKGQNFPEIMTPSTGRGLFGIGKSKITNKLLIWPTMEIARQITLIDFEFFKSIQPKECLNNAWNKNNRDTKAPNIAKMINFFNTFSNWIGSLLLQTSDLAERIETLEKFVEVAERLFELNNFNGVFAVCSGLCLASVYRLKKTWNGIGEGHKQKYQKLHRLISRDKNFAEIRTKIKNVKPPCIPYIGLYLTDLTFIEEGNQKYVNGKINFVKCQHFAEVIRDMQTYQNTKYVFATEKSLNEMITTLTYLSEKEQQEKSLEVEPKETKKGKK